ncbi:oleoyl-acyl carrier protein thioesterase, chloroplastic-like [Ipomoea triloba]|uniref:oleoyl-acyl carrier protein thioesterase, chloroplastic-like n=1 Tax=Ipomoea triloba TaxID=35885 RepID=UPI00125DB4A3|nr:oleoyl-acyl carrier protein thioesterase, chloroplastic-like [Ipomoea triloba]
MLSTCNSIVGGSDLARVSRPRFFNPKNPVFTTRRNAVVSGASLRTSPIMAVSTQEPKISEAGAAEQSPANQLRLGSLAADGFSFKEKFIIRCSEVGVNKTATIEAIANLLQEVSCNHAQSVGFSADGFATTHTMRKLHLIWVAARMHIEIYKYPAWSDVIEIETWIASEGRIGTRRDWVIKDYASGEVIGRSTSMWLMMNHDTRRLQKVIDDVRNELMPYCPKTPRFSFPEDNNSSSKKIPKLGDPAEYSVLRLVPRRADLDMNHHLNFVTYIGWVLESMPQEIIDTRELQTITLDYKRECQHDDVVDSLTSLEPVDESATAINNDNECFLHLLRLSSNGVEINRGRTEWRKKL